MENTAHLSRSEAAAEAISLVPSFKLIEIHIYKTDINLCFISSQTASVMHNPTIFFQFSIKIDEYNFLIPFHLLCNWIVLLKTLYSSRFVPIPVSKTVSFSSYCQALRIIECNFGLTFPHTYTACVKRNQYL